MVISGNITSNQEKNMNDCKDWIAGRCGIFFRLGINALPSAMRRTTMKKLFTWKRPESVKPWMWNILMGLLCLISILLWGTLFHIHVGKPARTMPADMPPVDLLIGLPGLWFPRRAARRPVSRLPPRAGDGRGSFARNWQIRSTVIARD